MSYRDLRRQQRQRWAEAERLLEEASGKPYRDFVELLPIPAALARPDLRPVVWSALQPALLVRRTGAGLNGDTCMAYDRTWKVIDPALALVVLMPEARVGATSLVCARCARRPDLRERAMALLRELYRDDPTMRVAHGPRRA
jgi:hypothetical protein